MSKKLESESPVAAATACCASFVGSETFLILEHSTAIEWLKWGQDGNGNATNRCVHWVDHEIKFDCRDRPFKRGDMVKVGDVELFVTGYQGQWIVAEGREFPRHNAIALAPPTLDSALPKDVPGG